MKFTGPADPMTIPPPPEDGSEPLPIDEERKQAEFQMYDEFAQTFCDQMHQVGEEILEYHQVKNDLKGLEKPLWVVKLSPEEQAKRDELEALRESKAEAKRQRLEEEKKAAEAAAAAAKKGGKGKAAAQAPTEVKPEEAEDLTLEDDVQLEDLPNSVDDDPSRVREFLEFKKIIREMQTGTATVGSILGAMVY